MTISNSRPSLGFRRAAGTAVERIAIVEAGGAIVFVDERYAAVWRQAGAHESPEIVECRRWYVRKPGAKEHGVVGAIRLPREGVGVDVRDRGIGDASLVDGEHARRGVERGDRLRMADDLGREVSRAAS